MNARTALSPGPLARAARVVLVLTLGLGAMLTVRVAQAQDPCPPNQAEGPESRGTDGEEHTDQTVRTCSSGGRSGSEQNGQSSGTGTQGSSPDSTSGSAASCTTGGGSEVTVTTDEGTRRSSTPDGTVCAAPPPPAPAPAAGSATTASTAARRSSAAGSPSPAPVESASPEPVVAQTPQIVAERIPSAVTDGTEPVAEEGGSGYGLIALIVLIGVIGAVVLRRRQLWERWAPRRPQVPEYMFLPVDPAAQAALRPIDDRERLAGVSVIESGNDVLLPWGTGDGHDRVGPSAVGPQASVIAMSPWRAEHDAHGNGDGDLLLHAEANGRRSSVIELPFLPESEQKPTFHPEARAGDAEDTASLWAVPA